MECKAELLKALKIEDPLSNGIPDVFSSGPKFTLPMPNLGEDTRDYEHHRWSKKTSSLCTYECWKCKRPGHLAQDCLALTSNQMTLSQSKSNSIPAALLALYRSSFLYLLLLKESSTLLQAEKTMDDSDCIQSNVYTLDQSGNGKRRTMFAVHLNFGASASNSVQLEDPAPPGDSVGQASYQRSRCRDIESMSFIEALRQLSFLVA